MTISLAFSSEVSKPGSLAILTEFGLDEGQAGVAIDIGPIVGGQSTTLAQAVGVNRIPFSAVKALSFSM